MKPIHYILAAGLAALVLAGGSSKAPAVELNAAQANGVAHFVIYGQQCEPLPADAKFFVDKLVTMVPMAIMKAETDKALEIFERAGKVSYCTKGKFIIESAIAEARRKSQ